METLPITTTYAFFSGGIGKNISGKICKSHGLMGKVCLVLRNLSKKAHKTVCLVAFFVKLVY